ncbi:MAG: histidine phosphatase family protein [Chitinophagaceae bacterium]
MNRLLLLLMPALVLTACGHTYYVVRHAEKAIQAQNMSSDVELTTLGSQRAIALKGLLQRKKISAIYSTNTIRTMSTAKPTADYFHVTIQQYGPKPDSSFIASLKLLKKNVLIVGHSNTVDDIVNGLTGTTTVAADLQDNEYDNLFVIKINGSKIKFQKKKYGK